jgi:broad specificity phosphatase PhoE
VALHLVRHGRPLPRKGVPAREWELDPAGFDDVWALRESGRLPRRAVWFSSPEPKATQTAQLLTESDVGVLDDLREQDRGSGVWIDDFAAAVRRAFAHPDVPAYDGWEPLAACRARVGAAARRVLHVHAGEEVVLVGHGTAWTLLAAELRGTQPDIDAWERLDLPDIVVVDVERPG